MAKDKKKFKIVSGVFHQGDTTFQKGDVVESHADLDKVFKNKFEKVGGSAKVTPSDDKPNKSTEKPFKLKKVGSNEYNVIRTSDKKAMNDEPLRKSKATKLKAELTQKAREAGDEGTKGK
jgi:hypothetical protein